MSRRYPTFLLDPVERQLDPLVVGRRFWIGVAKAACASIGMVLIMVVVFWWAVMS